MTETEDECEICGNEKENTEIVKTLSYPNEERSDEDLHVCEDCK